jgi:hypothetical protein
LYLQKYQVNKVSPWLIFLSSTDTQKCCTYWMRASVFYPPPVFYPPTRILSPHPCFIPPSVFYPPICVLSPPPICVLSPHPCFIPPSVFYPLIHVLSPHPCFIPPSVQSVSLSVPSVSVFYRDPMHFCTVYP